MADLKKSSKFNYEKEAVFRTGVPTTNCSESENSRLGKYTGDQELLLDVLTLVLHQQQLYYLSQFDMAYGALGDHVAKLQYTRSRTFLTLPTYAELTRDEFADLLINEFKSLGETGRTSEAVSSMTLRATSISNAGLVTLDSVGKVFTVRSIDEKQIHSVRYDNKKGSYICNCEWKSMCLHIRAVLIAQGIEFSENKQVKMFELNTLTKAVRKGKGRSGRKRPKVGDDDFVVKEAPDSLRATTHGHIDPGEDFDAMLASINENLDAGLEDGNGVPSNAEELLTNIPTQHENGTGLTKLVDSSNEKKRKREDRRLANPKEWLSTSEVEDGVNSVLGEAKTLSGKSLKLTLSMMETVELLSRQNFRSLMEGISQMGLLEADVVLQPMNTDLDPEGEGIHWVLGGIIWRKRVVFILNSARQSLTVRTKYNLFVNLMMVVHAAAALGKMRINLSDWKLVDCVDSPQQGKNKKDCGIFVILMAKAIASASPVHLAVGTNPRTWYDTRFREKKNYRVRKISRPLLRSSEPAIESCTEYLRSYLLGKTNITLRKVKECELQPLLENERQILNKGTCDADEQCVDQSNEDKFMCVRCRRSFHAKCKSLSKLEKPWPPYFFCSTCKPSSDCVEFVPYIPGEVVSSSSEESNDDEDSSGSSDNESDNDEGTGDNTEGESEEESGDSSDESPDIHDE